jgi:hypothetical protein
MHIEQHFQKGMTWKNYGEWQMMHIKPSLSIYTSKDFYRYVHYGNYRPIWKNRETKIILKNNGSSTTTRKTA